MKTLRIIAVLLAVLLVASIALTACTTTEEETSETTTTTATEDPTPSTTGDDATADDTTGDDGEDGDDEPPAETPVRAEGADEFVAQYTQVHVVTNEEEEGAIYTENFSAWNAAEDAPNLFDGKDGFFNPDEETKMGGGLSGVITLYFKTAEAVTLKAYAFISGNDSATYTGRNPVEWTLRGSTDQENWVDLDYVYDGAMEDVDHDFFGYTIDDDKQGSYQFYQLEITYTVSGGMQINEMYLYA